MADGDAGVTTSTDDDSTGSPDVDNSNFSSGDGLAHSPNDLLTISRGDDSAVSPGSPDSTLIIPQNAASSTQANVRPSLGSRIASEAQQQNRSRHRSRRLRGLSPINIAQSSNSQTNHQTNNYSYTYRKLD